MDPSCERVSKKDITFTDSQYSNKVWAYYQKEAVGFYEWDWGGNVEIELNIPEKWQRKGIGSIVFKEAVADADTFTAHWVRNHQIYPEKGMSDNLISYYKSMAENPNKINAAWNTWSGQQAKGNGFTKVVVEEIPEGIKAIFTRI